VITENCNLKIFLFFVLFFIYPYLFAFFFYSGEGFFIL